MKTLIIHPEDKTTEFLSTIYDGMQNCVILKTKEQFKNIEDEIRNADRVICLGHGTEDGLLEIYGMNFNYVIHSNHTELLKNKECIFIWCNADKFVSSYEPLNTYATGMIISETLEALYCKVIANQNEITESNIRFANAIKIGLGSQNLEDCILNNYVGDSPLYKFNIENIRNKTIRA